VRGDSAPETGDTGTGADAWHEYLAFAEAIALGMTAGRGRAEMERMPPIPRRVVTGHDQRGASVFAADGPVPVPAPGTEAGDGRA
jgi:hypothetical protein